MAKYHIAGATVNIQFADDFFEQLYAPYLSADINCPSNIPPLNIDIKVKIVDDISDYVAKLSDSFINTANMSVYLTENGQTAVYGKPAPRMLVESDKNYNNINILITPRPEDIYRPTQLLEYIYTGMYLYFCFTINNYSMLHGSAIVYKDSGIIFTAPCGTGKSTHANLWKQLHKNEVFLINDDKPIINYCNNTPWVFGTPFCGKGYVNCNKSAPLKAIIYIKQAPYNSMELLSPTKALGLLYEQTLKSIIDKRIIENGLNSIEKLLNTTPCYILNCLPDFDAVKCVEDRLTLDKLLQVSTI